MKPGSPAQPAPAAETLLAVARLVRPHGLRGEVSAIVLAPSVLDPGKLLVGGRFTLRQAEPSAAKPGDPALEGRTAVCEGARQHQERWLVKLAGFDSMTDAEALRGFDLCLARKALPKLPEGWHWEADLIGAKVFDARLGEIGIAMELEVNGGQDQLLMRRTGDEGEERGTRVRIPWVKAYVKNIDIEKKEIQLDLPEGFPGIED